MESVNNKAFLSQSSSQMTQQILTTVIDDHRDNSSQTDVQTKTRRQASRPMLKRGLSTVEEEEGTETMDRL
jgi:hypothetical protein